jgi:hypothetical protein
MFNDDQKPVDRPSGRPLPALFDWAEPALMTQAPPARPEITAADTLLADATGGDGGDSAGDSGSE